MEEYVTGHPELAERIRKLFAAIIAKEQPAFGATVDLGPPTERVGQTIGRYEWTTLQPQITRPEVVTRKTEKIRAGERSEPPELSSVFVCGV